MDVSPARPYRDTSTGDLYMLTDYEIAVMGDDHPFRRIGPDEPLTPVANPETEIDVAQQTRWGDDGGEQSPTPAPRPGYAFEGGYPGAKP